VIANVFPIVTIELQGLSSQTTLIGAVVALTRDGMSEVALLVLATTLLFPLIQLGVLLYLLLPEHACPAARLRAAAAADAGGAAVGHDRSLHAGHPGGADQAVQHGRGDPGPALWSFGGLTVLLTVVVSFNPRYLWHLWEQQQAEQFGDKEAGA
jgi:paraquat-inducible protein A